MDVLDNRDDMPRKRARMEEYHDDYEMDLDQDLDLDESLVVEAGLEEARWIAVDEYGLPLLGFAPTDHSGSSTFVGLSRYAIDVDSIVRQGFGDGSDASIGMDMCKRFRPCGAIVSPSYQGFTDTDHFQRDLSLAVRFTISSITASRIIFEDEISVRKALMFVCQTTLVYVYTELIIRITINYRIVSGIV